MPQAKPKVLVVDRDRFFEGGPWPQGFTPLPAGGGIFLQQALAQARFVERELAESTEAWKQWIPYCMLRCGDWSRSRPAADDDDRGVFVVQRTNGQSEQRLHGSWSVGLGGHIEPPDAAGAPEPLAQATEATAGPFFASALSRELEEELRLPEGLLQTAGSAPRLIGLINDDSTAVGRVHAGLAYCLDVSMPVGVAREKFGIREISKMHGAFTPLVEFANLWQTRWRFETWSQHLIQAALVGAMVD
ncbi:MAG: hypothetical protein AB8H80_20930 [Planctomycetota bacterium]